MVSSLRVHFAAWYGKRACIQRQFTHTHTPSVIHCNGYHLSKTPIDGVVHTNTPHHNSQQIAVQQFSRKLCLADVKMDDVLRPKTVPLSAETILWFEFLLDANLLTSHLAKSNACKSINLTSITLNA